MNEDEAFTEELMISAQEQFKRFLEAKRIEMDKNIEVKLVYGDEVHADYPPAFGILADIRISFLNPGLPTDKDGFVKEEAVPVPHVFGVSTERWTGGGVSWGLAEAARVRFRVKWRLEDIGAPDDPVKVPEAKGLRVSILPEALKSFTAAVQRANEYVEAQRAEAAVAKNG